VDVDVSEQCEYVGPLGALCDAPAQWTIGMLEDPYDLLDACTEHVGELLVGGRLNYVWPAIREESLVWPCRACGNQTPMDEVDCWHEDGTCLCASCTGRLDS
jgi:hypothetical protein